MIALLNSYTDTVKILLEHISEMTNINAKTDEGYTAMILANKRGYTDVVDLLKKAGAKDKQRKDFKTIEANEIEMPELTELEQAVLANDIERVRFLMANGADPNAVDPYDRTALMFASERGYTNIVKLLLEYGSDVNAREVGGCTALMLASERGYTDIVKLLLEHTDDTTYINAKTKAWYYCRPKIREGYCTYRYTALRKAEINGYKDVVDLLKKAGAKRDDNEDINKTLLAMAIDADTKGVRYLIDEGADVNAKDDNGKTVLMFAAEMGSSDLIEYLIENKADVNAMDNDGNTALLGAVQGFSLYQTCIVKMLIDYGADVNAKNHSGDTALIEAVRTSRHTEVVKLLITHGADVNAENKYGATALRVALKHRRKRIAYLLRKAGAKE
jgi:ankyrin repeat protein